VFDDPLDAEGSAAKMINQIRPHKGVTQPWTKTHRLVDILYGANPPHYQVNSLSVESHGKAVGDESEGLLLQDNRLLSQGLVKGICPAHSIFAGCLSPADFH